MPRCAPSNSPSAAGYASVLISVRLETDRQMPYRAGHFEPRCFGSVAGPPPRPLTPTIGRIILGPIFPPAPGAASRTNSKNRVRLCRFAFCDRPAMTPAFLGHLV